MRGQLASFRRTVPVAQKTGRRDTSVVQTPLPWAASPHHTSDPPKRRDNRSDRDAKRFASNPERASPTFASDSPDGFRWLLRKMEQEIRIEERVAQWVERWLWTQDTPSSPENHRDKLCLDPLTRTFLSGYGTCLKIKTLGTHQNQYFWGS